MPRLAKVVWGIVSPVAGKSRRLVCFFGLEIDLVVESIISEIFPCPMLEKSD
jgi:hypothetical protein